MEIPLPRHSLFYTCKSVNSREENMWKAILTKDYFTVRICLSDYLVWRTSYKIKFQNTINWK